jgi:hypothetical protein
VFQKLLPDNSQQISWILEVSKFKCEMLSCIRLNSWLTDWLSYRYMNIAPAFNDLLLPLYQSNTLNEM